MTEENPTREDFERNRNSRFLFERADGSAVALELLEVDELAGRGAGRDPARGQSFSLLFRGPASLPLEQGTYAVTHPDLGTMAIFIVPVGADPGGIRYEAIFNRL